MPTHVIMPQMGESVVEGTVSRWLKQEGDPIAEFESIVEVETDKVTSEIPAPASGVVLKIYVPEGQTVNAGTLLAAIGQVGESVAAPPGGPGPAEAVAAAAPVAPAVHEGRPPVHNGHGPHMTPLVARIAAEHQVDVTQVAGTGRGGRVTKKDILAFIEQRAGVPAASPAGPGAVELPPWEQPGSGDLFKPTDDPPPAPARPPDPMAVTRPAAAVQPGDRLLPLDTMRRRIAEHMVLSKLHTAPHATTVFEVDMSAVARHREAHKTAFEAQGARLTYTAYIVAALAQALRHHPLANSQWTTDGILLKGAIHVGLAVALEAGLIVPVIRNADELSLLGLARRVGDLADRARRGDLKPEEVSGGTFTLTNHGVSGSLFATPIINQPQSGILGVGAIQKRVAVLASNTLEGDALAVRPMVYLSFTFDHRVLDGATADAFLAEIKRTLEGWEAQPA